MSPEIEAQDTKTIPIFPLIRKLTGIRLREGSEMEYALSLITESQPQINLMGNYADRITKDQIWLVVNGIIEAGEHRWKNLNPLYVDRLTPILDERKKLKK